MRRDAASSPAVAVHPVTLDARVPGEMRRRASRLGRGGVGYRVAMAYNCVRFEAPASDVFAVLTDAGRYPRWLVGAKRIRHVDPGWPVPGSRFHHRVGVGPFFVDDHTEVLAIDPPRHLRLLVRAGPFVRANVDFELIVDGSETVVCMQEEPTERIIGNLVRPALDPLTHLRNHRSLHRLAEAVRVDVAVRAARPQRSTDP